VGDATQRYCARVEPHLVNLPRLLDWLTAPRPPSRTPSRVQDDDYDFNRPGVEPSEAIIQNWWRQGMTGPAKAHYDGIVALSQTDFTEDLKQITVPVLVMHGDDDQIVPYADSGPLSAKLVQNGTLKTYEGFPHGITTTQADTINADLLAFVQSGPNDQREGAGEAAGART
jgi:pimeloyl-ACP methyl ester carboxylesterase